MSEGGFVPPPIGIGGGPGGTTSGGQLGVVFEGIGPGGQTPFPIFPGGGFGALGQQIQQAQLFNQQLLQAEQRRRQIVAGIPSVSGLNQLGGLFGPSAAIGSVALPATAGTDPFGGAGVRPLPTLPGTPGPPPTGGGGPTQGDQNVIALISFLAQLAGLLFGRSRRSAGAVQRGGFNIFNFPPLPPLPQLPQLPFPRPSLPGGPVSTGGPVSQVPIFPFPSGGESGLFGGGLPAFLQGVGGILGSVLGGGQPTALPGGAPPLGVPMPMVPTGIGSLLPSIDLPGFDIAAQGATCISPMQRTSTRLPSRVDVPNGRGGFVTFKNMGRPVLWSGDLAACKRVRRVATRAKRAGGR